LRASAVGAWHSSEVTQALNYLEETARLTVKLALPGEYWSVKIGLGNLYNLAGKTEAAQAAYREADRSIEQMADKFDDPEQRRQFLRVGLEMGHNSIVMLSDGS
jgi:hypothetical protein